MDTKLQRQTFDRDKFNKTIDTAFSQLATSLDPSFFDINLATVDDFFELYEKLFYEIPKLGDINSHEYLAKTSGEYAGSTQLNEQIQALLEEITSLREENLELREENISLLTSREKFNKGKIPRDELQKVRPNTGPIGGPVGGSVGRPGGGTVGGSRP